MINFEQFFVLLAVVLFWETLGIVITLIYRIAEKTSAFCSGAKTSLIKISRKICTLSDFSKVTLLLLLGFVLTVCALLLLHWAGKSFTESVELASIAVNNFLTPTLLAISIFLLYRTLSVTRIELNATKEHLKKQENKELYLIYVQELKVTAELLKEKLESPMANWNYRPLRHTKEHFDQNEFLTINELNMLQDRFKGDFWHPLYRRIGANDKSLENENNIIQECIWNYIFDESLFDMRELSLIEYFRVKPILKDAENEHDAFEKLRANFLYAVRLEVLQKKTEINNERSAINLAARIIRIKEKIEQLGIDGFSTIAYTSVLSTDHMYLLDAACVKFNLAELKQGIKHMLMDAYRDNAI